MTMYQTSPPRDGTDRLYVSRKAGGRGIATIEDCADVTILEVQDYVEKSKERLIQPWRRKDKQNNNN